MKKALVLALGLVLMAGASYAAEGLGWGYLGIGGGADIPISPSGGTAGFGGNVLGGYAFNDNSAIQLEVDNFIVSPSVGSIYDLRPLAEYKYSFKAEKMSPYLLVGAGLDMAIVSTPAMTVGPFTIPAASTTSSNFDVVGGAGLQFDLGGKTNLFVQAKANFVLASTVGFDLPVEAGLLFNL